MTAVASALEVPQSVIDPYADGAGNSEIKNLLTLAYLLQPEAPMTAADATAVMNAGQGDETVHRFYEYHIDNFCEISLAAIAGVIEVRAGGWQARPEFLLGKKALAGFYCRWGLDNEDLSIQQAYGISKSASRRKPPSTRQAIYELLVGADRDMSVMDIAAALGPEFTKPQVDSNIKALDELGILRKDSNRRGYDPEVKIQHTEYWHNRIPLDKATAETQALYKAIKHLGAGKLTSVVALIDLAKKIDPDIDTLYAGLYLRRGLNEGHGFPGLQILTDVIPKKDEQTLVDIEDLVLEPITALVRGVASIRDGSGVKVYAREAEEIFHNESEFRRLVDKSKRFSPFTTKVDTEETKGHLAAIVAERDFVTLAGAQSALAEQYGCNLSKYYVARLLRDMADSGQLQEGKTYIERHSKIASKTYSMNNRH